MSRSWLRRNPMNSHKGWTPQEAPSLQEWVMGMHPHLQHKSPCHCAIDVHQRASLDSSAPPCWNWKLATSRLHRTKYCKSTNWWKTKNFGPPKQQAPPCHAKQQTTNQITPNDKTTSCRFLLTTAKRQNSRTTTYQAWFPKSADMKPR